MSLISTFIFSSAISISYPLLDGKCNEYQNLNPIQYDIGHEITLSVFEDKDYVWICYNIPNQSFGTLDLQVTSPNFSSAINLHVSAQLGDWMVDDPASAPQEGNSDKWWKINGWFANTVFFNGLIERDGRRSPNWSRNQGREMQLSKAHFGKGKWDLNFNIRAIMDEEGNSHTIDFPANKGEEKQFLTLNFVK